MKMNEWYLQNFKRENSFKSICQLSSYHFPSHVRLMDFYQSKQFVEAKEAH